MAIKKPLAGQPAQALFQLIPNLGSGAIKQIHLAGSGNKRSNVAATHENTPGKSINRLSPARWTCPGGHRLRGDVFE